MTPNLRLWLGACYRAQVIGEGNFDDALRIAKERITADEGLMAEAEKTRREMRSVVKAKGPSAHIEGKCLEYLDRILEKQDA